MGIYGGKQGVVYAGSAAVAQVTGWNYGETGSIDSARHAGSDVELQRAGHKSGRGSISYSRDPEDATGQNALAVGETVSVKLYFEATGTSYAPAAGDNMRSGDVIIESIDEQNTAEGHVTGTANFVGILALGTHPGT
jgi:hypothetical protein